jgi:hypothetical protein
VTGKENELQFFMNEGSVQQKLNLGSDLPAGIYLLSFLNNNQLVKSVKLHFVR